MSSWDLDLALNLSDDHGEDDGGGDVHEDDDRTDACTVVHTDLDPCLCRLLPFLLFCRP